MTSPASPKLQAAALTAALHGSGAPARRMLDAHHVAAGLTHLVLRLATPGEPHMSGLDAAALPALQVVFAAWSLDLCFGVASCVTHLAQC